MMSTHWYALHCKPRMEACVAGRLELKQIEFYYPARTAKPVNSRSQKIKPYFPGYIFVRLETGSAGWSVIKWMPGVNGLVCFDGCSAPVACRLIEAIRAHVDKLNTKDHTEPRFTHGDEVQVAEGALTGMRGIFDIHLPGSLRSRVLLKILGGQFTRVELPARFIEPIKQT